MQYLSFNHKNIDTVIFDFDGTLAELNINFDLMRKFVDKLLERYGIDPQRLKNGYILEKMREAESILTKRSPDKAKAFISEAYLTIEKIEVEAAERGQLFDQTRELLSALMRYNIKTGIITRNCFRAVRIVFPDVSAYCPVVVSREDVAKVKPHTEHILRAINLLSANHQSSMMIGDHLIDIQTGRNAGTFTAGVMTGNFRKEDFIKAGADIILHQASDILSYIKTAAS